MLHVLDLSQLESAMRGRAISIPQVSIHFNGNQMQCPHDCSQHKRPMAATTARMQDRARSRFDKARTAAAEGYLKEATGILNSLGGNVESQSQGGN